MSFALLAQRRMTRIGDGDANVVASAGQAGSAASSASTPMSTGLPAGGDELDHRWLAAVADYSKKYTDISTGWRRQLFDALPGSGGSAWLEAMNISFNKAKVMYAEGFASRDDNKRREAVKLLEKAIGTVDEYASQLENKPSNTKWPSLPSLEMPWWGWALLVAGGVVAAAAVILPLVMPLLVARASRR